MIYKLYFMPRKITKGKKKSLWYTETIFLTKHDNKYLYYNPNYT